MTSPLYLPPTPSVWTGRMQPHGAYWHHHVQSFSLDVLPEVEQPAFALLGYACDAGVTRNLGRAGAAQAPDLVWSHLARLSWHLPSPISGYAAGTIICEGDQLEISQRALADAVAQLQKKGYLSVVVGGGHEIAFGHGLGLLQTQKPHETWGILNIDAHFDLRMPAPTGTSGTPFYQLLTKDPTLHYAAVGIQPMANPPELFASAKRWGVQWLEDTAMQDISQVKAWVGTFLKKVDKVYLSLDMDALNQGFAPGVSAPNPLGLSPNQVASILEMVASSGKLASMDVAECNPTYDQDGATLRLAARLIGLSLEAWATIYNNQHP